MGSCKYSIDFHSSTLTSWVSIVDVHTFEVVQSLIHQAVMCVCSHLSYHFIILRCKGILCSIVETFVTVGHHQRVILYLLQKGLRWALPLLENIDSVIPIHRNTGFAARGQGVVHVVDIAHSIVVQVLKQSGSDFTHKRLLNPTFSGTSSQQKILALSVCA